MSVDREKLAHDLFGGKWEYHIGELSGWGHSDQARMLNHLGSQGWELVSCEQVPGHSYRQIILKRRAL